MTGGSVRCRNIPIIEDAAEALEVFTRANTPELSALSVFLSFNGNKIITTGGGGAFLADEAVAAVPWHNDAARFHVEYWHDEVGYNYRMPNLNAALGCAQLSQIDRFISIKRQLAEDYAAFFDGYDVRLKSLTAVAQIIGSMQLFVMIENSAMNCLMRQTRLIS